MSFEAVVVVVVVVVGIGSHDSLSLVGRKPSLHLQTLSPMVELAQKESGVAFSQSAEKKHLFPRAVKEITRTNNDN